MNRGQLITRALRFIGDTSLTDECRDALDDILLKIETIGYWGYLHELKGYQTENTVDAVALSTINDGDHYSKGMWVSSVNKPYKLERISHKAMKELQGTGESGDPYYISLFDETLYLSPQPVTGSLPLLSLHWFKKTVLPTDDGDELDTTPGIPKKYHSFLVDGVAGIVLQQQDDDNAAVFTQSFLAGLQIMIVDNADYTPDAGKKVDEEMLKALFFGGKVNA